MAADLFAEVKKILDNAKSVTENGAIGYQTTGKALLDMNFKVSSYRSRSESEILGDFIKALAEDPVLALKWAFYVGDIREGLADPRLRSGSGAEPRLRSGCGAEPRSWSEREAEPRICLSGVRG